LLNNAAAD
jgi:hypothetical protein